MSPDRRRGGGKRGILEGTEDSKKSLVTGVALESGLKRRVGIPTGGQGEENILSRDEHT